MLPDIIDEDIVVALRNILCIHKVNPIGNYLVKLELPDNTIRRCQLRVRDEDELPLSVLVYAVTDIFVFLP